MRFTGGRKPTVCARLSRAFLADIDAAAARKGITRTALIEEAVRLFLAVDSSLAHTTNGRPPTDPQDTR